jgi:hypothetical protein
MISSRFLFGFQCYMQLTLCWAVLPAGGLEGAFVAAPGSNEVAGFARVFVCAAEYQSRSMFLLYVFARYVHTVARWKNNRYDMQTTVRWHLFWGCLALRFCLGTMKSRAIVAFSMT